jgi:hypothetical protein
LPPTSTPTDVATSTPTATDLPPTSTPTATPVPANTPTPTLAPGATLYAADGFSRSVTNGWGTADLGGTYTLFGGTTGDFNVSGSAASLLVTAGTSRSTALTSVSALNLDSSVRLRVDKVATGGFQYVYLVARRVASGTEYRGRLRFSTTGALALQAIQVSANTETLLGTETGVAGVTQQANSYIWLRMQVSGTSPTTLRLKAWADGQSEPVAWQYSATDSLASLQAAGGVGLRALLASSSTNAPVSFSFDDWRVSSVAP